jgi:4-carboxymuconolactone decarboxylase
VVAHFWQAQYEWAAHEPIAAKQGVEPATIRDLRAGRAPKKAAKDERALYDFIRELFKTKRVGNRNYARVTEILGNAGTVELVGLVGYYSTVAMTLNVFRMPVPEGTPAPFKEKAAR